MTVCPFPEAIHVHCQIVVSRRNPQMNQLLVTAPPALLLLQLELRQNSAPGTLQQIILLNQLPVHHHLQLQLPLHLRLLRISLPAPRQSIAQLVLAQRLQVPLHRVPARNRRPQL